VRVVDLVAGVSVRVVELDLVAGVLVRVVELDLVAGALVSVLDLVVGMSGNVVHCKRRLMMNDLKICLLLLRFHKGHNVSYRHQHSLVLFLSLIGSFLL
jgi:hypothetical protein